MEENKEEMPSMTAAEFVRLATNHEVGDPTLWAYIDETKNKKVTFDGKEWPVNFAISEEDREKINAHIDAIFNICRESCIPITVVMQETNLGGIGTYNVMNVIPRDRAGRKLMEVGNIVQAFIGDGTIESNNQSLEYTITRTLANMSALFWKAKNNEMGKMEFLLGFSRLLKLFQNYVEKLTDSLPDDTKMEEPAKPNENNEKENL